MEDFLGPPIDDPDEESFLAFSHPIPSHLSLGFINAKAQTLDIPLSPSQTLTIRQSPTLLTSKRTQGTTGAVAWRTTLLFAAWLPQSFLFRKGFVNRAGSTVVELGAGVSGIVALAVAPLVKRYIATDQDYVLKLLKSNIEENLVVPSSAASRSKGRKSGARTTTTTTKAATIDVSVLELDWEVDPVSTLTAYLGASQPDSAVDPAQEGHAATGVSALFACDTIYNESLIVPFNSTCEQICRLRSSVANPEDQQPTVCVIAQQLRSFEVFSAWLSDFHKRFHVWRVPDHHLDKQLREGSGYVVHVGILR